MLGNLFESVCVKISGVLCLSIDYKDRAAHHTVGLVSPRHSCYFATNFIPPQPLCSLPHLVYSQDIIYSWFPCFIKARRGLALPSSPHLRFSKKSMRKQCKLFTVSLLFDLARPRSRLFILDRKQLNKFRVLDAIQLMRRESELRNLG